MRRIVVILSTKQSSYRLIKYFLNFTDYINITQYIIRHYYCYRNIILRLVTTNHGWPTQLQTYLRTSIVFIWVTRTTTVLFRYLYRKHLYEFYSPCNGTRCDAPNVPCKNITRMILGDQYVLFLYKIKV